ncbi:hypothetical protein EDM54_01670 [Brevibacillus borstelensis]|nr:hypothetical protein EDM54_01670 [Brevibacillus borstelensis]GED53543.1 hypothetical protein BBO01nite_27840 [Brevibacillus borstelensis]
MEFLKIIPMALFGIFRILVKSLLFVGVLILIGVPAFLLCWIPQVLWDWGPGPSLGLTYGICLLTYIGYRINRGY